MSGEFGDECFGGYMHKKIEYAAEDCAHCATMEVTRKFGEFLSIVADLAKEISFCEANDTDEEELAECGIALLERLQGELVELTDTFKDNGSFTREESDEYY